MNDQTGDISPYDLTEDELLAFAIPTLDPGHKIDQNLPDPLPPTCTAPGSLQVATHDLGNLAKLPAEILQLVLSHLDIETLAQFRLVNHKANLAFQELPEYRWLAARFARVLLAIYRLGTGRWITYADLFNEVHRPDCEGCGDFAAWMYLLTCRRVCYTCLTRAQRYLPMRPHIAHQRFGIDVSLVMAQPHMHSIPGIYSGYAYEMKHRKLLVDRQSAYQAALDFHGSAANMQGAVLQIQTQEERLFAESHPEAVLKGTRMRRRGDIQDTGVANAFRYMAIVSLPWMNKAEQRLEWGVHCKGCRQYTGNNGQHYQRKFSIQGFRDHLQEYGAVYRLACSHSERWRHRGQPRPDHWPE